MGAADGGLGGGSWQQTWVTHIVNAGGKDHGGNLQISQLLGKVVIGQKAAQGLCHVCCMYVVMVGVVVVCSLYVLPHVQIVVNILLQLKPPLSCASDTTKAACLQCLKVAVLDMTTAHSEWFTHAAHRHVPGCGACDVTTATWGCQGTHRPLVARED